MRSALLVSVLAVASPSQPTVRPPRVPKGIDPCGSPLHVTGELPRTVGETLRFLVDVDGLSVGTVDFKVERRGTFEGETVTEYRSVFALDALVSAFVPAVGRAAALVPESHLWSTRAMNDYTLGEHHYRENVTYQADGTSLRSVRTKDGKQKEVHRRFQAPALDFVAGFYAVRTLAADTSGCTVMFGNQRAYTLWIAPDGEEEVATPVGSRLADRFRIRYASEASKKPVDALLWLGKGSARVPYRAEIMGKNHLVARIHVYEKGTAAGDAASGSLIVEP